MNSGKEREIFRSSFERKENGDFSGTILMGMEYSRAVPALVENGICYQTCTFKDESMFGAKAGDNQFVFYDFQSGKNTNLGKHYCPVEYVGGFYIIDAKNKTYLHKTYTTDVEELDEEELQRSYVEYVTGMTYGDRTFAFSTG